MRYWDYFRNSKHKMQAYMIYLNDQIHTIESITGDTENLEHNKHTDDNIKKYILLLEEKLEDNFRNINFLKAKIDEYLDIKRNEQVS
mmetsp:Transcript_37535/g.33609  ORF Transcript_37535/g.33609 Transcript_37535/m.33609 type:complete len:87 (+) Transcript_37535:4085-4345(+)